jgi:sugar/nucleoside kinase (ribokinase family)
MARERVIVSIGEALLCEFPDRTEPGGLALSAALAAVRAGHRGMAISRVGQDAAGERLMHAAHEAGVNVEHIQSDPDLPTGRLVVRSLAGKATRTLSPVPAAFDNLQWDFDLVDVAQHADAVVFGHLARRGGQSRSVIKQFLAECRSAVRVFDLTNRASETLDRGEAWTGLEFAEVVVADEAALRALAPAAGGDVAAAAQELARSFRVQIVIVVQKKEMRERFIAHTSETSVEMKDAYAVVHHDRALMGLVTALLDGAEVLACVQAALDAATANDSRRQAAS